MTAIDPATAPEAARPIRDPYRTPAPAGGALVPIRPELQLAVLEATERMHEYADHAKAPATIKAYRSDWRHFTEWAEARGARPMPADPRVVGVYLADCALTMKASTISRRLSSISQAHQAAGHPSPTTDHLVRSTWAGIRRTLGTAQKGKAPVLTADLRRMVEGLGDDLRGRRDRALLLVGFAGAFRRSELVGLDATDIVDNGDGLVVTLRRSKTDQEGEGRPVGIPYGGNPATCPVRALRAWLAAASIDDGPLFRPLPGGRVGAGRLSDRTVARIVKARAGAVGIDPTSVAGHSLRSGLATSAAKAGASERAIMAQTGHKSVAMVRRYIRDGDLFRENAAAQVGL